MSSRTEEAERLRLLPSLILAVTQATDLDSGLGAALETMGRSAGWALGQAWLPNSDGLLRCSPSWYCGRPGLEALRTASERALLGPGMGLPGRAWATRTRVWTLEATANDDLPRALLSRRLGLKAGVAIPIFAEAQVAAVLEFFWAEVREEDEKRVGILETVLGDLGFVIRRKADEDAVRASELQLRSLVDNAKGSILLGASRGAHDAAELRKAKSNQHRFEAERLARQEAEQAVAETRELARRRQVLVEASGAFAIAAHEPDVILHETARYCVELIGDGCALELTSEEDRDFHVVAFHCRDPDCRRTAERLLVGRRLPRLGISAQVVESGSAVILPTIGPADADSLAGVAPREFLESFPVHSAIVAPLSTRDGLSGAILLSRHTPSRPYVLDDLSWLLDLMDRASLAVDNARLYRDLRAAVQIRDDFLAVAGHELKTPLAAMLMQIQSVQRAAGKRDPAVLADRLSKAGSSGKRLERLVNQLLDVSRITAGRLRLEPETMDLSEVVKEVVARFSEVGAVPTSPIISVHCEAQVVGYWDRTRIDQVINNLVANALKYGRGKPVDVDLHAEGGEALLRVVDHGIGIDVDHQKRIFERFERAVTAREFGGFGLGLWISRQIVEASGGRIEVESARDEGATFTVHLPLKTDETLSPERHVAG